MKCPYCKKEIDGSDKYCKYCGKELPDTPKRGKWFFFAVIGVVIAVVLIGFLLLKNHLTGNNSSDLKPSETADTGSLSIGDSLFFGHYEQDGDSDETEEIEWIILDNEGDKVLIISKYALDCIPFNNESGDIKWNESTIRRWLNEDFFESAFSNDEKRKTDISDNENPGVYEGTGLDGRYHICNDESEMSEILMENAGCENTGDSVFLLTADEANKYLKDDKSTAYTQYAKKQFMESEIEYAESMGADLQPYDRDKLHEKCEEWYESICDKYGSDICYYYWLRSAGSMEGCTSVIDYSGMVKAQSVEAPEGAVRPAMWIQIDKER